jgi:transcription initiation factor IIE alpha subunit
MNEKEFKCPKCGSDMKVFINKLLCRNLSCREVLIIDDLVDIIFQEHQAKKELVEALEDSLNNLESKLQYAKNNAMRRWWNIENNLLRDILNKYKGE